jgi:hypothetical protein|nr:MAG TPA: hypothetical protein [Caudoviricetes sp.]
MNIIGKVRDTIRTSEKYYKWKKEQMLKKQKKEGNKFLTAISQKIVDKNGRELFKPIGGNALLLGGSQNIINNIYYNMVPSEFTEIRNLDSEPGANFEGTVNYLSDKRVIFGYGIGNDGVIGLDEAPVLKYQKGYDFNKLVAFQTVPIADDNPIEMHKQYAMRHVDTGNGYVLYFIKKTPFSIENITTDGTKLPNNPHDNYNGKLDVSSRVSFNVNVTRDELIRWFGYKYNTQVGALMNSIILFAGRPAEVTIKGQKIETFRDVIATNKANIADVPLGNTNLTYLYELFYV